MPDTRPGITFDAEGVCSACRHYENRKNVDWDARFKEFEAYCDKYRGMNGPGGYDCAVAVSGGKDSHFQVWMLKEVMHMNPILFSVEDNFPMTQAGIHNLKNISEEFGCTIISCKPNIKVQKTLMRKFFEKYGKPTWYVDRLIYTFPLHMAAKFNTPMLCYGENVSFEYGGNADKETYSAMGQIENGVAVGMPMEELLGDGVTEKDLSLTLAPSAEERAKLDPFYMSYFVPWNSYKNYQIAKAHGFHDLTHEWDRTHHAENFDQIDSRAYLVHSWLKYPKFGHAAATDYTARYIRYGMMTREEAIPIIKERDGKLDPLCVRDFCEFCGYTEHDIFGNQAPFYFDLSCKDLYQTLSLGATCHIFSKKLFTFPMLLLKEMERVGVTAINWATSAFHFVASSGALSKCAPPTLRKAALGGEALQARYVNAWKAAIPGLEVVNMYGPTETTVDCAAFHLTRDYRDDEAIPIGKACRNMQIILLDKDGKSVPDGEAGEICVRGSGLASGYFGNWEKDDECFIQNPTTVFPHILYRTGDIAVKKDDGLLYFLSRQDGQIKHMGYRIELGEIETALHSVDGIAAAACLFDRSRDRILCIYEGEPDAAALARAMRRLVPKYMLPNIYEKLDALPMNANGKIDRVKLKEQFIHAED